MTKKVNGKNKGNSFERKIANTLSDRFANHLGIEKGFRRNPDSGSFFGGTNESRTDVYDTDFAIFGDLICPRAFNFAIECKHYKSAPVFKGIINGEVTQWDRWLEQAQQDSEKSKKKMMLIIKYNNVDEIVMVSEPYAALRCCFEYKNVYCYKLGDFLALDNSEFFSQ